MRKTLCKTNKIRLKMIKLIQLINMNNKLITFINKMKYILKFVKVMGKRYRKVLLALIGLGIFTAYFWMRFLRTRTIKELPLHLSIEGFFILLYLVIIFIYIIISLLFGKNSNPLVEKILDIIFIFVDKILIKCIFLTYFKNILVFFYIIKTDGISDNL